MWTEVPDILHNDFHVAYKYFTRQTIAKVPWITDLERILYKRKNACLCKKTEIYLYWLCILYQSILPIIKNKKHLQIKGASTPKSCKKTLLLGSSLPELL